MIRQLNPLIVVDLGFGSTPTTTLELARRLWRVRPDALLRGIEIDREGVTRANQVLEQLGQRGEDWSRVSFLHGGFETPLPGAERPTIIRAFNVLRQYDETDVENAWRVMQRRIHPRGLIVDGTCDELGRVSSWIAVNSSGPQTFTVSLRLTDLESPLVVAERLPKSLIHHNVPGELIHDFLLGLDRSWRSNSGLGALSSVQRWVATVESIRHEGWPVRGGRQRWRLGELTLDWTAVAPR